MKTKYIASGPSDIAAAFRKMAEDEIRRAKPLGERERRYAYIRARAYEECAEMMDSKEIVP